MRVVHFLPLFLLCALVTCISEDAAPPRDGRQPSAIASDSGATPETSIQDSSPDGLVPTPDDFMFVMSTDAGVAPYSLSADGGLATRGCATQIGSDAATPFEILSTTPKIARQLGRFRGPGQSLLVYPATLPGKGEALYIASGETDCQNPPYPIIAEKLDGGNSASFPAFSPD
jgi:hypothetical protein